MDAAGDQDAYDLCSHSRNLKSGLQIELMLSFKGDVNQEPCAKCGADDQLPAFQARSRTRQERTLIIAQQAEAWTWGGGGSDDGSV